MCPGLRTSFPVLLFTVHLASPPDGNLKTTHRSQHRTPHPCTFFHRGFLTLHRCYFLVGPGEEKWRAKRTLRVPGPGESRLLGSVWRGGSSWRNRTSHISYRVSSGKGLTALTSCQPMQTSIGLSNSVLIL